MDPVAIDRFGNRGGEAMTRLNYLAIMCDDPITMRDWYQRWFGFDELNRTKAGSVYITDGHFTVGLLKRGAAVGESQQERGLHHFGFQVESILEIERNLEDFDPAIRIERRPSEDPYAEYRVIDPEGIMLDLSEKGYGVQGEPRIPGIRHLATTNRDIPRKYAFYTNVLGMRNAKPTEEEIKAAITFSTGVVPEGNRFSGPAQFGGDGFMNLALLPAPVAGGTTKRLGFDHFGILVRDPLSVVREMGQADDEGQPVDVRPAMRMVEYGVQDAEGNRLDLSGAKGWKIDVDRWAKIR
jgi:catechol 2,3-dioxygenase-like lactoylglutathione lyase family enzyme